MRLDDFLPYRLAVAAEAVSHALSTVYRDAYGLTREEWRILAALDDTGLLSSVEIARRTALDKVQVCRAAQRLEDRRLILRAIDADDRRLRLFGLTQSGKHLFAQVFPAVHLRAEELLANLSADERAVLERVLAQLQSSAGQIPAEADFGDITR